MRILERVYDNSPIFLQNVMCSLKGYLQNKERYGKDYWKYRAYFKEFDALPAEKKEKIQLNMLHSFLRYVVDNSMFYKELYRNVDIDSIKSINDLKLLPIVDKEMLRKNIDRVVTIPEKGAVIQHTGGTTGKSLVVRMTRRDMNQRMAMLDNFKSRVGFENLKMKRATFNGKHIVPPKQKKKVFWRYNAACKQMIYSSFHLTEDNMDAYVRSLNSYKPNALDGFFTSMCDLASYIERKGISLEFQPVAIFPTSETLTQTGRELLERVFGCKVYDQYASSEGAPFATECRNQVLHIELASGVFENIDESNSEVLVTSFTTHGTPLIRYRIGDRMIFDHNANCNCGLCEPVVKEIQGRRLDYLYTPKGAKINAGNVANLLKNIPNSVIRAQFIQEKMDEITVLLEVEKGVYTREHEDQLKDEFVHKFGEEMKIHIIVVDEIPREKSGKFLMIKNKVVSK